MLFRSCAQGQEQELFQFEAFCALINVSTPKDTTILASPMLGTLDVALHEDSLESGHLYRVKRSLLEALDKFEAVSSARRLLQHTVLIQNVKLRKNRPQSHRIYSTFSFFVGL